MPSYIFKLNQSNTNKIGIKNHKKQKQKQNWFFLHKIEKFKTTMIKIKLNRGYVELNWKKPDLSQVLIPSDTNPIYKEIEHATNMNPNPRSHGKFKSSSNSDIENLHLKFSQSKQPKLYHNFNLKDNDKQATKVI